MNDITTMSALMGFLLGAVMIWFLAAIAYKITTWSTKSNDWYETYEIALLKKVAKDNNGIDLEESMIGLDKFYDNRKLRSKFYESNAKSMIQRKMNE